MEKYFHTFAKMNASEIRDYLHAQRLYVKYTKILADAGVAAVSASRFMAGKYQLTEREAAMAARIIKQIKR